MPADIVIYALVAAGLVLWLRNVLGTRHGDERQRPNPFAPESPAARPLEPARKALAPPAAVPAGERDIREGFERNMTIEGEQAERGLMEIIRSDRLFDPAHFMRGAQDAFVMIVEAFAAGDRETLQGLLAEPVYQAFSRAIDERERQGRKASVEIHAVRRAEITDARLDRRMAYITVRFVADETNLVFDADGRVISGNQDRITETIDIWTFGRDIRSRMPAWLLCETRDQDAAGHDHKTVPDSV